MVKLALAIAFIGIFSLIGFALFVWLTKTFFPKEVKEEKSVDTSQTTTEQSKIKTKTKKQ